MAGRIRQSASGRQQRGNTAGRTLTVELTDEQLAMVETLAADYLGHSMPETVQRATNYGLDMVFQAHTTPPAPPIDWGRSKTTKEKPDGIPF